MTDSLRPRPETIPETLKAIQRWVLWKWFLKDGEMKKVPLDFQERAIDYTSAATWRDFPSVWARYETVRERPTSKVAGIGFVLDGSDRMTLFDYDHEIDPQAIKNGQDVTRAWRSDGTLDPTVRAYLDTLQTYTEVSTSGRGVHVLALGDLPAGHRNKSTRGECYSGKTACRFFTVTGHRLPEYPATIEDQPAAVLQIYEAMFGPLAPPAPSPEQPPAPEDVILEDVELLQRAREAVDGEKFARLWAGDRSGYDSPSEADLALANLLAFWVGGDPARIDHLFRQSGLMRAKWNDKRGATTYGQLTITKAVAGRTATYAPSVPGVFGNGEPIPDETAPADLDEVDEGDAANETPMSDSSPGDVLTPARPELHVVGGPDDPTPPPPPPPDPDFEFVTPDTSFISQYVRYCAMRTDAPPLAHEAVGCTLLSALAGPQIRIPLAGTVGGRRLILWTFYIANTTLSRKTTTLSFGTDILETVLGADAMLSWDMSPQAFIQKLAERDGQVTVADRDEYSSPLAQMNRGGYMVGMSQNAIRAYDCRTIENRRTTKRDKKTGDLIKDVDRAVNPYLVQLLAGAEDRLLQVATRDNVDDGLLARMHFYTGTVTPRREPLVTPAILAARDAVLVHARRFHARCQRLTAVPLTDEVNDARWDLERAWRAKAEASPHPLTVSACLVRLADSVLKVGALLAIDLIPPDQAVVISLEHYTMARTIVSRWLPTTVRIIEAVGQTIFSRQCAALLARVQQAGAAGITLRAVYRALNIKKRDADEVIGTLQSRGQVRVQEQPRSGKGGGKHLVLYPVEEGS